MKPLTKWDIRAFVKHQIRVSSSEEPLGYLFIGERVGVPFQALFTKEDVLLAVALLKKKIKHYSEWILISDSAKSALFITLDLVDECFQIQNKKEAKR